MITARVAVFGGEELRSSVVELGFEPATADVELAVIDLRDERAAEGAALLPRAVPRVFVVDGAHRRLIDALGVEPARVVETCDPAVLGPVIMSAIPVRRRSATRVVLVTSVRGGVGRTLLATNLAIRIAPKMRVCVIDATGTGAAAWWLRAQAQPWSTLEGLVDELSADQLNVLSEELSPGLRVVGGASLAPTDALLSATTRAATALDDLVIIDAPVLADKLSQCAQTLADRVILLAYDDPLSLESVDRLSPADDVWVIASQAPAPRLGSRDAFLALPRDESSVRAALMRRERVRGRLGQAYDDLAELLLIDAS